MYSCPSSMFCPSIVHLNLVKDLSKLLHSLLTLYSNNIVQDSQNAVNIHRKYTKDPRTAIPLLYSQNNCLLIYVLCHMEAGILTIPYVVLLETLNQRK